MNGSPWVMASESESGHYSEKTLGKAMRRLFILEVESEEGEKGRVLTIEHATPHDLRRTMRTHLGETLGVEPHIAERCLNHSLGKLTATYDKGEYLEQRRNAMSLWADWVASRVNTRNESS